MLIKQQYENSKLIKEFVTKSIASGTVDFTTAEVDVTSILVRNLIVAAASYHETSIINLILEAYRKHLQVPALVSFMKRSALDRQYHTFFEWNKPQEKSSINKFLSFFGDEFKERFKLLVSNEKNLRQASIDFLTIGGLRNKLVHSNYATYSIDFTLEEVYQKYSSSSLFISKLDTEISMLAIQ